MKAYLEPYLEVESGAGMAGGVEQPQSDAAINTSANENRDSERRILRQGAAEVAVQVGGERKRGVRNGGRRRSAKKPDGATWRPRVQRVEMLGCEGS